jgi:uncharacterized protein YggE
MREETKAMSTGLQTETQNVQRPIEGVTVIGEAVRGVQPESAEFLIEITASSPTAAQALRDNHLKTTQVAQAVAALGVQQTDLLTISLNVYNLYSTAMQGLGGMGGMAQIGQGGFGLLSPAQTPQTDVQFGSYSARKTLRVVVREPGRAGEIVDAISRAGATVGATFSYRVSDEAAARRSALEMAAKDARAKAESLAAAAGKQLGEPLAISEDIVASNGTYNALRSAIPFAFGAGAPQVTGELEYYARVSARFRFQ